MFAIPATGFSRPRRWWQFSLRSLLLAVLFCALVGGVVSWWLRPKMLDPGYFPIGVGYRWVYASKDGNTQDDVVFEVIGTENVGDTQCFVVLRTIGDHHIKFYVDVTERGVWIHQVGEDRFRPAYRQFAFNTKQDDHWNWKGMIGDEPSEYECWNYGEQLVTVPLGQWEAFMIGQYTRELQNTDFWLVEGIGVVRISAKSRDKHDPPPEPGEGSRFDWQLKEFYQP